jgi:hypothetical protein
MASSRLTPEIMPHSLPGMVAIAALKHKARINGVEMPAKVAKPSPPVRTSR